MSSTGCPKYCNGSGCYDTIEVREIANQKVKVVIPHCKTLKKAQRNALKKIKVYK